LLGNAGVAAPLPVDYRREERAPLLEDQVRG
jgi:hypothetical protein